MSLKTFAVLETLSDIHRRPGESCIATDCTLAIRNALSQPLRKG